MTGPRSRAQAAAAAQTGVAALLERRGSAAAAFLPGASHTWEAPDQNNEALCGFLAAQRLDSSQDL